MRTFFFFFKEEYSLLERGGGGESVRVQQASFLITGERNSEWGGLWSALAWAIFKVFTAFAVLLLFRVLVFWPGGM